MCGRRQALTILACLGAVAPTFLSTPSRAGESPSTSGAVVAVTLYRGQAQIVRSLDVDAGPGSLELIVTNLPRTVVPDSIFAEGSAGIEVRAVRHRTRAVGEEPHDEIRGLDEKIEAIQDDIALNEQTKQLMVSRLKYLDELEGFVAPTAKVELSKGILDPKALSEVTRFSFEERETAIQKQLELRKTERKLKAELSLLTRQRNELTGASSRSVHEAILFLEKTGDARETVRVSYLVNECGWSPSYNFRADSKAKKIRVEYNAVISQMSGEDWSDVRLTLSTASPALSAAGPGLAPFHVALGESRGQKGAGAGDVLSQLKSIQQRQQMAMISNTAAISQESNIMSSWSINDAANDYQILELTCPQGALATLRSEAPLGGDGPSLSYQLAGTVSLTSRSDQQMIRILETDIEATMYYVATPVLSDFVYREAELTNSSDEDLLAGPVSVYLDRRFVGRTEISTVARGQTFVVGLGADPQIRTSRELVDRELKVQGGNNELSFKYRLVLESYKDAPVPVRLHDRVPHAGSTADIRITLFEMTDNLSEDPVYLRLERPDGVLRWDIEVPAGASGSKARFLEYGYKVEYDRKYFLASPTGRQEQLLQQEFEEVQLRRSKR